MAANALSEFPHRCLVSVGGRKGKFMGWWQNYFWVAQFCFFRLVPPAGGGGISWPSPDKWVKKTLSSLASGFLPRQERQTHSMGNGTHPLAGELDASDAHDTDFLRAHNKRRIRNGFTSNHANQSP